MKKTRERATAARAEAEARVKAERASVERAAAEARERAAAAARMNQQKNENDLESFFGMGARASSVPRPPRANSSVRTFFLIYSSILTYYGQNLASAFGVLPSCKVKLVFFISKDIFILTRVQGVHESFYKRKSQKSALQKRLHKYPLVILKITLHLFRIKKVRIK